MATKQPVPPKKPSKDKFLSNPFYVGLEGIKALFTNATGVAIILTILSAGGAFGGSGGQSNQEAATNGAQAQTIAPEVVVMLVLIAIPIVIGLFLLISFVTAIAAYTGTRTSKGQQTSLKQAASAAVANFWPFAWMYFLVSLKTFLWSLLFIIPGIIMAVRYSYSGMAFFDEDKKLRGNAAIKDSLELSRGGWMTTFASQTVFSVLSLGILSEATSVGSRAILYRQFRELQADKLDKPSAHWLSVLVTVLFWGLLFLAFSALIAILLFIASGANFSEYTNM